MSVRWGVLGTGSIAAALTEAVRAEGGEVVAVSSADPARAAAFATAYDIERHHAPHHELLAAGDLDVAYVATTNDRHHADVLACLEAGVAVLAEKPFALDLAQTDELLAAAQRAGVFLMEAMWMRFQPAFLELEHRLEAGQIGPPALLTAHFGISLPVDPTRRWFAREQGGGSLVDVGVYPLTLALAVLGEPEEITALAQLADTGVDAQLAVAMRHPTGLASWSCSFVADLGVEATVAGPEGSLRLHAPFHHAPRLTRHRGLELVEDLVVPGAELGYRHEVREVHRCLAAGRTQSERMPWELTRTLMRWLDALRAQVGVTYPGR